MKNRKTPAQYIKEALKVAFPGVKFSCKYSSFSGGDDVHVSWKGGPLRTEVEAIAYKFQAGHFDGMIDMYEYDNDLPCEMTAKYVFCEREAEAEEVEERVEEMGYTAENLLNMVSDLSDWDKTRGIASIIRSHFANERYEKGEQTSHEQYQRDSEIGNIISRFLVNNYCYNN